MLHKLRSELEGQYPPGCAKVLEEIEKSFVFEMFNSQVALSVGNLIVQISQEYKEDVIVRITRESDELTVFQYVGNSKSQRNIDFALAKRNTVLKTGHCSLWAMAQELTNGGLEDIFQENSNCLPVGGAFPIYVGKQLVATIAVSGLRDGKDHKVIEDALCSYLNKEIPVFKGKLI